MRSGEVGVCVAVWFGLAADGEKAATIELAASLATEGVMAEPPPMMTVDPGMTATHLQYRLGFRVARQTVGGVVQTQGVQRMPAGFRKAGIQLPEARRGM